MVASGKLSLYLNRMAGPSQLYYTLVFWVTGIHINRVWSAKTSDFTLAALYPLTPTKQ
ncbi:MAG: hypothetical protein AB1589_08310 [Cyanobacteriota bacterium]